MANPLTLYIPIKQDAATQQTAEAINAKFAELVAPGLDATQNVHYARMALIPNADPTDTAKINAILLMTEFDKDMTTYLGVFWDAPGGGIMLAFKSLAGLMLNGPADPGNFTFTEFVNFIVSNNLNNDTGSNYSAYPQYVTDILNAFPTEE
ncbi:hypothetical protein BH09BAC6_BH09BAC6_05280 [soil metagenome]|jgi:hypothetical protein